MDTMKQCIITAKSTPHPKWLWEPRCWILISQKKKTLIYSISLFLSVKKNTGEGWTLAQFMERKQRNCGPPRFPWSLFSFLMSYWFEQHTHSLNWWCRCHLLRNSEQRSDTTRRMGGHGEVTIFADTNLGTRIAFNAPPDITAASLKSRFIKKNSFFSSTLHVLGLNIFPIWRFCWFCCVISLVTFASVWLHVFGLNNTVSLALIWNCCSDDDFEEEYVLWVMYIFCTCLCWEWGSFARV